MSKYDHVPNLIKVGPDGHHSKNKCVVVRRTGL